MVTENTKEQFEQLCQKKVHVCGHHFGTDVVDKLKEQNQSLSIYNSTLQIGNQQFAHQVKQLQDRVRELEAEDFDKYTEGVK